MKLKLIISLMLFCFALSSEMALASSSYSVVINGYTEGEIEGAPERKSNKKAKNKKNKTDKKFPLYATISVSAAVLALFMLGLGIFLKFNIFMGIIAAVLAISALILAIIGLKKGESRSFSFIGIMLGAVALLGAIFFAISV